MRVCLIHSHNPSCHPHQHHPIQPHSNKDINIWPRKSITLNLHIVTLAVPTRHKSKNQITGLIICGELGRIMCHLVIFLNETITTTITQLLGDPDNLVFMIEIIMQGENLNHGVRRIVQLEILGMHQVEITQSPE